MKKGGAELHPFLLRVCVLFYNFPRGGKPEFLFHLCFLVGDDYFVEVLFLHQLLDSIVFHHLAALVILFDVCCLLLTSAPSG